MPALVLHQVEKESELLARMETKMVAPWTGRSWSA